MLKGYVLLLIRILDNQTHRVNSSVFRLQSASQEHTATANKGVHERIDECQSLQEQLRVFKGVWLGHRASLLQYDCYNEGPARWAASSMRNNSEAIEEDRRKVNAHEIAGIKHQLSQDRLEANAVNQRRAKNPVAGPPMAMLTYSDTMSMKPGRSDMSNKEWKRFEEECLEWFKATAIGRLLQSNQTRLVESVLDSTLQQRTMMAIKERTKKNFVTAPQLLEEAAKHRDTLLYPRVIQTWEFIRRYVSESDKLN